MGGLTFARVIEILDPYTITFVENIAAAVWDKLVADHEAAGSFGQKVGKKLLTTGKFVALK